MFDTDNSEACTVNGDSIRGQFPYDSNGRIILDVSMIPTCSVCMKRWIFAKHLAQVSRR
jgi:hypothetical protein